MGIKLRDGLLGAIGCIVALSPLACSGVDDAPAPTAAERTSLTATGSKVPEPPPGLRPAPAEDPPAEDAPAASTGEDAPDPPKNTNDAPPPPADDALPNGCTPLDSPTHFRCCTPLPIPAGVCRNEGMTLVAGAGCFLVFCH